MIVGEDWSSAVVCSDELLSRGDGIRRGGC